MEGVVGLGGNVGEGGCGLRGFTCGLRGNVGGWGCELRG